MLNNGSAARAVRVLTGLGADGMLLPQRARVPA